MNKIWTNGCFDVLHIGHIRLLKYARSLGDQLTVGIDSDRRVQELKGNNRPINDENSRKEMLLSVRWVDNVIVFDSDHELEILIQQHSDQMIIGSDYRNKRIIGSQYSKVEFFDKIDDHSTTSILTKIIHKGFARVD
jgi:D-beta-D-heptose 7-phosphate kinase/D-beta-D-heptose 1-phosphate adenosyltransferase